MAVSRSQYADWLMHPVTQEAKEDVRRAAEDIAARVLTRRVVDQEDLYLKGFLSGIQEMLGYQPEITEEV